MNSLTAIADSDDANYSASVTCDANGNITEIHEQSASGGEQADLYTYFTMDWNNRVTDWKVKRYDFGASDWEWTKREHEYDATNRLVNSTYKMWLDAEEEPSGDSLEHTYAGARHLQNYDGSSSYGEIWHWAGASYAHAAPLKSPNADTSGQAGFNLANDKTPQRRTVITPTTEGDERHLYGQGKPMPKDASGAGTNWGTGIQSDDPAGVLNPLNSRLDFDGTVQPTDLDRATDAREKGRIGIFGSALSYAGSSPRITSEPIGRDINPLGRGSGMALVGGELNLGRFAPRLPLSKAAGGTGSSVNNCDGGCGGDLGGDQDINDPCDYDLAAQQCISRWLGDIDLWLLRNQSDLPPGELICICELEECLVTRCDVDKFDDIDDWRYRREEAWRAYCECILKNGSDIFENCSLYYFALDRSWYIDTGIPCYPECYPSDDNGGNECERVAKMYNDALENCRSILNNCTPDPLSEVGAGLPTMCRDYDERASDYGNVVDDCKDLCSKAFGIEWPKGACDKCCETLFNIFFDYMSKDCCEMHK